MTLPYPHYSRLVRDCFEQPLNAGDVSKGAGRVITGAAGETRQGTRVQFQMRVDNDEIVDVRFRAYGCPHTIAAASLLARSISGQKITAMPAIDPQRIAHELELPDNKLGRVLVAEDALKACIENYWRSNTLQD